ncbi:MAG: hypothetical protein WAK60_01260 [Sedimentisphaerales bacterium]
MTYKPNYIGNIDRSKEIVNARKWGVSLIGALIGIGLFVSEVKRILQLPLDLMNCAYITLFIITGGLIFLWIWSTDRELDLLLRWLDPKKYEPPSGIKETLVILGYAVFLVILLFTSRNPLWYSCFFSIYSLIDLYGGKLRRKELSEAFVKSKERARADLDDENLASTAELYIKLVDNLEFYFIKRPHEKRLITIAIFSVIGLGLSVCWATTGTRLFGLGAYMMFIVLLIASELTIWRWRSIRDNHIRPIKAEIYELAHENKKETD